MDEIEYNLLINKLIKEKGGTKEEYENLMNRIGYHESKNVLDQHQFGGGPGRGKFQFEEGIHSGGITAAKRTKKYFKDNNMKIPKWLDKISNNNSLDASKLTNIQQNMLFLGNMREHPKANLSDIFNKKKTISDFWADYHWAGPKSQRKKRLQSYNNSIKEYEEKNGKFESARDIHNKIREMRKNRKLEIPQTNKFFQGGKLMGYIQDNYLNEFNNGGTHEENPLGGIPQGIGSNGKQNTTEENETSFVINGSKYIFSNRIKI